MKTLEIKKTKKTKNSSANELLSFLVGTDIPGLMQGIKMFHFIDF